MHRLGTLGLHAERARQRQEIDRRIDELHADILVDLVRDPLHGVQALLENAIGRIIEDHEDRTDVVARRGPQRLRRIERAAVADDADHGALRQRQLGADRGGQAPADAAAAQPEIALRIVAVDELADARRVGQSLLDHDGILGQHRADRLEQRQRLHRNCVRKRARLRA